MKCYIVSLTKSVCNISFVLKLLYEIYKGCNYVGIVGGGKMLPKYSRNKGNQNYYL